MGSDAARKSFAKIIGGQQQLDREKKGQHAEQGYVGASRITLPCAVDRGRGDDRSTRSKCDPNGELARTRHGAIV